MIKGKVIKGEGVARNFNYPTANLDVDWRALGVPTGVYAGRIKLAGREYGAAVVIKNSPDKFEAHLIGYAGGDFYGAEVEVSLLDKISEIEAVSGARLRKKIASDMEKIRKVLTNYFRVRKYRR